jgi:glutamyl-tRNA synthetase
MPDRDLSWHDLVRGEITFRVGSVPDPVLVRGDGNPLYTLTNPTDDALMRITHVIRAEDLLSSTPRQIALYEAFARVGVGDGTIPWFGHVPLVTGEGSRKLSKRDPEINLFFYRDRGFLPAGLLNYLALLGWSIADDRDVFGVDELIASFDVSRVSSNPARFDLRKAVAINAVHLRALPVDDFVAAVLPHLAAAGLVDADPTPEQRDLVTRMAPLVQERCVVLSDAVGMLGFLFADEHTFEPEPESAAKVLHPQASGGPDPIPVLDAALRSLEAIPEWTAASIEEALKQSLVDGLGLKPRKAFAPIRVAVTGRTVSPPLYESMELLGRERSMRRLQRAAANCAK